MKRFLYFIPALLLLWGAGFSLANANTWTLYPTSQGYWSATIDHAGSATDLYLTITGTTSTLCTSNPNAGGLCGWYVDDSGNGFYTADSFTPNVTHHLRGYTEMGGCYLLNPQFNVISWGNNDRFDGGYTNCRYTASWNYATSGITFTLTDIPPPPPPTDNISIVSPTNGATAIVPTSTTIFYQTAATSTVPNVESYHVYSRLWTTDPNNYIEAGGYFDPNAEYGGTTTTIPYPAGLQLQGGTNYTEQSYLDYCVSGITFTCYPSASSSLVAFSTPYTSTANDQISLTYPINGSTSTDVSYFQTKYKTTFTGYNYEIDVNVSTSSDMSGATLAGLTSAGGQSSFSYQNITNNEAMASSTTYYAQASLIYYPQSIVGTGSGQLVATSSIISFTPTADFTGNSNFYLYSSSTVPSSTATSSAWTLDCSNFGLVGNSLCSVLGWLFVPPAPVMNAFVGNLLTLVKTKAPFGWFYEIITDIQGINASSTPAFSILNGTVVSTLGGAFGIIDEYIAIGVVVLFMFWIFHRFRNIKL